MTSISSPEYQAGSARNHKGLEFKGPVGDTGLQEWPGEEADGGGSVGGLGWGEVHGEYTRGQAFLVLKTQREFCYPILKNTQLS